MRSPVVVALVIVALAVLFSTGSYLMWQALKKARPQDEAAAITHEIPGTGSFLIESQMSPGTYRAENAEPGCSWSLFAGGVAAHTGDGSGALEVTVSDNHTLFRTSRCGTWKRIED